MKNTRMMQAVRQWIGIGILALGLTARADTKTREIDKTTVRRLDRAVKVTTDVREVQTRTTREDGTWQTTAAGLQSKTTETTDWKGTWDENSWEGKAGLKNDTKLKTQVKMGNSTSKELGKTRLEDRETVWEGEVGPSYRRAVNGKMGSVAFKAEAGASGTVRSGEFGYEAQGKAGLEAELKGMTRKFAVGDSQLGASIKGSGRLEASVIAKGRMGAYVDDKGITFGAEGSAGVYAKGELKMSMEAHVFGVKTNVNLVASGYAGAMAEGKAIVTLGWNGKVSFMASLGASVGFGGGVAVEFEMDAEELMNRLNFTDIAQLLEWMKEFQENPAPVLAKLGVQAVRKLHEAGFGALKKLGTSAATVFEHQVLKPIQRAGLGMKEGVQKGIAFLGRLIKSPRGEAGMEAVNAVLDQAGSVDRINNGQASLEFPLCRQDLYTGWENGEWDGEDPYAWYPFEWPCAYSWPCL